MTWETVRVPSTLTAQERQSFYCADLQARINAVAADPKHAQDEFGYSFSDRPDSSFVYARLDVRTQRHKVLQNNILLSVDGETWITAKGSYAASFFIAGVEQNAYDQIVPELVR